MWGQLSSLGQVLKESAETVAREAGLDQQLVSLDVIGTDISIHLCLKFHWRAVCAAGSSTESGWVTARQLVGLRGTEQKVSQQTGS